MSLLTKKIWSPFFVGAGIGLLSVGSYYFFGQFLGASSAFVTLTRIIISFFNTEYANSSIYFSAQKSSSELFYIALIIGIIAGGRLAAHLSSSLKNTYVPELWKKRFGNSYILRAVGAFIGGICIIIGARLAGGCTSGKAISSGLQLLLPAWIFIATLFATGVIVVHLLYRKRSS